MKNKKYKFYLVLIVAFVRLNSIFSEGSKWQTEVFSYGETVNEISGILDHGYQTGIEFQSEKITLKPVSIVTNDSQEILGSLAWQLGEFSGEFGHFQDEKNFEFILSNKAYLPSSKSITNELAYGGQASMKLPYFEFASQLYSIKTLSESSLLSHTMANSNFDSKDLSGKIGLAMAVIDDVEKTRKIFLGFHFEKIDWQLHFSRFLITSELNLFFYTNRLFIPKSKLDNLAIEARIKWVDTKEDKDKKRLVDLYINYFDLNYDFCMANGIYRDFSRNLAVTLHSPLLQLRSSWGQKRIENFSQDGSSAALKFIRTAITIPWENFKIGMEIDQTKKYAFASYGLATGKILFLEPLLGAFARNEIYDIGLGINNKRHHYIEFSLKLLWRISSSDNAKARVYYLEIQNEIEEINPLFMPQTQLAHQNAGFSFLLNAGKIRLYMAFMSPVTGASGANLWFLSRIQATFNL